MVTGIGRIVSYAFNGLDMSSAANDVIVVQYRDGSLHSGPFNVRFGKLKVLRPQDKVVHIEVNDVLTKAVMKINSDGDAFWLEATTYADSAGHPESPVQPLMSPILSAGHPPAPGSLEQEDMPAITLAAKDSASPSPVKSVSGIRTKICDSSASPGGPTASTSHAPLTHSDDGARCAQAQATIDEINRFGDEELASVLGAERCPPPAPLSAEVPAELDASKIFEREMSLDERQKYNELLRSITEGASRDEEGREWRGLTLSKLASYDEFSHVAAAETTPVTAPLGNVSEERQMDVDQLPISNGDVDERAVQSATNAAPGQEQLVAGVLDNASVDEEIEGEPEEEEEEEVDGSVGETPVVYYKPTITPKSFDLEKLGLVPGHNKVKYITHTSLQGKVVVESSIYLWSSDTKIVVSDIDGTVTKSDVWGHILPMIGKDWTHPGICSLYSKVSKNGYEFVYLTARSMSQQEQTRKFLWSIEQDGGMTLPRGPVLTAPDRFFTALTQEVSKRAHEFKISCLDSIRQAFPRHSRPFYAGFGNRIGDVISYTATLIPKHKIFIIDTNSTLHVCRVKQTYRNLAHLVDVTFPPLKPTGVMLNRSHSSKAADGHGRSTSPGGCSSPSSTLSSPTLAATQPAAVATNSGVNSAVGSAATRSHSVDLGMLEGESIDPDFNSFNFWRMPLEDPVPRGTVAPTSKPASAAPVVCAGTTIKKSYGTHPMYVDTGSPAALTLAAADATAASQTGSGKGWRLRWFGGASQGGGSSAAAPSQSPQQNQAVSNPTDSVKQ